MNKIRSVSLIDPCELRRTRMQEILPSKDLEIRFFENSRDFLSSIPSLGVVLIFDSEGAIQELRSGLGPRKTAYPHIVYSDHPDWRRGVNAMRCGAVDYVMVPCEPEDILASINSVEVRSDQPIAMASSCHVQDDKLSILTRRERQVLAGVVAGFTSRSIGERLGISPRTVEIHRANMMRKIEVRRSADLIRYMYQLFNAEASAQIMRMLN